MQCTPEIYEKVYLGANTDFNHESCDTFEDPRPMTMALSVLVVIELLNALNRFAYMPANDWTCMYGFNRMLFSIVLLQINAVLHDD